MAEILVGLAIAAGAALVLLHQLWLIEDRLDAAAASIFLRPLAAQIDPGGALPAGPMPSVETGDHARTGADRAHLARRMARDAGPAQTNRLPQMFDPVSDEVLARYRKFAGDLVAARR